MVDAEDGKDKEEEKINVLDHQLIAQPYVVVAA
jgi:hypothetical protein